MSCEQDSHVWRDLIDTLADGRRSSFPVSAVVVVAAAAAAAAGRVVASRPGSKPVAVAASGVAAVAVG